MIAMKRFFVLIVFLGLVAVTAGYLFLDQNTSEQTGNTPAYSSNEDSVLKPTPSPKPSSTPAVQPSGVIPTSGTSKIAWMSDRDGNFEIYVRNPDGTGLKQLTHTPGRINDIPEWTNSLPEWSVDGKKIFYSASNNIPVILGGINAAYVMDADGSNVKQIVNDVVYPDSSPDGAKIVFSRAVGQTSEREGGMPAFHIFIADIDGTNIKDLTKEYNIGIHQYPLWSPDGKKILFQALGGNPMGQHLFTINPDGTNLVQITRGGNMGYGDADWSPNGKRIAAGKITDPDDISKAQSLIVTMNADGSDEVIIARGPRDAAGKLCGLGDVSWSPDGTKIVYSSFQGCLDGSETLDDIYIMNADGSNQKLFAGSSATDRSPDWQPVPN